jgi:hypothetical protein
MGLVSQIASAWHGLDVQASSKWHSSPVEKADNMGTGCGQHLSGCRLDIADSWKEYDVDWIFLVQVQVQVNALPGISATITNVLE